MYGIWINTSSTLSVDQKFETREAAETYLEAVFQDPEVDRLWIKTNRGFHRISAIDEFGIARASD